MAPTTRSSTRLTSTSGSTSQPSDENAVPLRPVYYCANCQNPATKVCNACSAAYANPTLRTHYCSRECQVAHWPTHRKDCKRAGEGIRMFGEGNVAAANRISPTEQARQRMNVYQNAPAAASGSATSANSAPANAPGSAEKSKARQPPCAPLKETPLGMLKPATQKIGMYHLPPSQNPFSQLLFTSHASTRSYLLTLHFP